MSYDEVIKAISSGFAQFTWLDALDIIIIFLLLYKLIVWTKETRAYEVLKGIGLLFLCSVASQLLQLNTLSWLLDAFLKSGSIIIVLVVLFQPEFRRVLERLGRGGKSIGSALFDAATLSSVEMIQDVQRAILSMARRRVGALIVVEQKTGLGDIINTGTPVDGLLSGALLENIFEPNTPLHDGAVIVRGSRIAAAGCFLPLSDDMNLARELGTRHRAALGVSTVSDSVTIVVSEETGAISLARDGKLVRYIDAKALHDILEQLFLQKNTAPFFWTKRREKNDKA
ncbi:MAG: diadenylate cyclase CdaA [Christensenellales bacterium]|nr:diadenylate cyclase CdaA [Clostridium sp.]MDO4342127.1 diadenylate cyclase CdaA [Eubacteriales bacterium]MDY6080925.1 diadenylate cyclase CdaA [Eubacteriales bacterium]